MAIAMNQQTLLPPQAATGPDMPAGTAGCGRPQPLPARAGRLHRMMSRWLAAPTSPAIPGPERRQAVVNQGAVRLLGSLLVLWVWSLPASGWALGATADLPLVPYENEAEELPLPPPPPARPEGPAVNLALLDLNAHLMLDPPPPAADPELESVLASMRAEGPRGPALDQMLYEQLRAVLPDGGEGLLIDRAIVPAIPGLPPTGWSAHFDFRIPQRGLGMVPYSATITGEDGRELKRFSGSVRLDREACGVTPRRVIRRGETITADDVQAQTTRLSALERGAIDDCSLAIGTVARQELRPGRWLTEQMLEQRQVIKRGQGVTIRLARGPISITAPGITGQAGALGQVIRVQNAQTRRDVFARVLSEDEVQVIF